MTKLTTTVDRNKLETHMSRTFKASRERLWEAFTDPEQVVQWWGPRKYKTTVDQMDVTVGGKWRFVHEADGETFGFRGEYRELEEPEKITWTFEFEGMPGHITVETISFEDLGDGTTKISVVSHYDNLEDLNGMVDSGMEDGAAESYDRLAELVETA
jgi:uncharacterized protein YndB with AHSA1/START domain